MDGKLFLVRHLLLLRDRLVTFDAPFVQNERVVDLDRLRGTDRQTHTHTHADTCERYASVTSLVAHAICALYGGWAASPRWTAAAAAAGVLIKNSRQLLTMSRDNALFRFLQEGLPRSIVVSQRDSRKVGLRRALALGLPATQSTLMITAAERVWSPFALGRLLRGAAHPRTWILS